MVPTGPAAAREGPLFPYFLGHPLPLEIAGRMGIAGWGGGTRLAGSTRELVSEMRQAGGLHEQGVLQSPGTWERWRGGYSEFVMQDARVAGVDWR